MIKVSIIKGNVRIVNEDISEARRVAEDFKNTIRVFA